MEKRRREVISAGISQVSDVLISNGVLAADNKLNKADVLRKGVEYIEQLQAANERMTAVLKSSDSSQADELRALGLELDELCAGMLEVSSCPSHGSMFEYFPSVLTNAAHSHDLLFLRCRE